MPTRNPHFIDILIGKRIRHRRIAIGLSQKELGSYLGVSFQQIQKYEKGFNRVSAKCLLEIAQKLEVPMNFFMQTLPQKKIFPQKKPSYTTIKKPIAKKNTPF